MSGNSQHLQMLLGVGHGVKYNTHRLSHAILTVTLQVQYYYYCRFIFGETEAKVVK